MSINPQQRFKFGPFTLDSGRQRLLRDGQPVALKPQLYSLLQYLLENNDRLVGRDELIDYLWPNQAVPDANLTQCIYELRRALGDGRRDQAYLKTVARRGYRLRGSIFDNGKATDSVSSGDIVSSIAVLPFAPLSPGSEDEALEYGAADALITSLSKIENLKVRQVHSQRKYVEVGRDPLEAGHELDVDVVLDGTLQRAGDRLRISARLIRVSDEVILWADKFDYSFNDIFAIEDEICEQIVKAIAVDLSQETRARVMQRHTEDAQVHELFLKCRHYWLKWTPGYWFRAIEAGNEAIARDPQHAPSYAWVAMSYCTLGIAGVMPPREAFPIARDLTDKSLKYDPMLSEAYEARGAIAFFHDWDYAAAERDLYRAVELGPMGGAGRGLYGLLLSLTGRRTEGRREMYLARDADPLSLIVNCGVGMVNYYQHRFDRAAAALEHTLELDEFFANARLTLGYVYTQLGRHDDAIATMETAASHMGLPREEAAIVGFALAAAGDHDAARAIRDRLVQRSLERYTDPLGITFINTALGEREAALHWLAKALEARSSELIYAAGNPIFNSLRTDPGYRRLMQAEGLLP